MPWGRRGRLDAKSTPEEHRGGNNTQEKQHKGEVLHGTSPFSRPAHREGSALMRIERGYHIWRCPVCQRRVMFNGRPILLAGARVGKRGESALTVCFLISFRNVLYTSRRAERARLA